FSVVAKKALNFVAVWQRYKSESDRVAQLTMALEVARRQLTQLHSQSKAYEKLQQAHMQQLAAMQRMQDEINKLKAYRETAHKQEKVIARMETVMEHAVKEQHKNKQL